MRIAKAVSATKSFKKHYMGRGSEATHDKGVGHAPK